jgi:hypothetical protein
MVARRPAATTPTQPHPARIATGNERAHTPATVAPASATTSRSVQRCPAGRAITPYARVIEPNPAFPPPYAPVPLGPRSYRNKLRGSGPLAALVPPALLGLLSVLLLRHNTSLGRGLVGFLLAVLAAPGLLVAGAPLRAPGGAYTLAVIASAAMWLLVGVISAARATRSPVASWRDFWREYAWLAAGAWLGVLAALVAVNLVFGRALF